MAKASKRIIVKTPVVEGMRYESQKLNVSDWAVIVAFIAGGAFLLYLLVRIVK